MPTTYLTSDYLYFDTYTKTVKDHQGSSEIEYRTAKPNYAYEITIDFVNLKKFLTKNCDSRLKVTFWKKELSRAHSKEISSNEVMLTTELDVLSLFENEDFLGLVNNKPSKSGSAFEARKFKTVELGPKSDKGTFATLEYTVEILSTFSSMKTADNPFVKNNLNNAEPPSKRKDSGQQQRVTPKENLDCYGKNADGPEKMVPVISDGFGQGDASFDRDKKRQEIVDAEEMQKLQDT